MLNATTMRMRGQALVVQAFWLLLHGAVFAAPSLNWHLRNPLPTIEPLSRAVYVNGVYYLVGGASTNVLLLSTNGTNWTTGPSCGLDQGANDIIFVNGRFIVGGRDGISTSEDGTNWIKRYAHTVSAGIRQIAYGNGLYIAVGDLFSILVSVDGINWTNRVGGLVPTFANGVAFGQGKFVAVADGFVRYSSDGLNWNNANGTFPGQAKGVTFGHGLFVTTTSFGFFSRSTDGVNWTMGTSTGFNGRGIASSSYGFVAVGESSQSAYSTNGTDWTLWNAGTGSLLAVSGVNGRFVGAGINGNIISSITGTNWATHSTDVARLRLYRVVYAGDRFLAGGDIATLVTSMDGTTWTKVPLGGGTIYAIARGSNNFIAGGSSTIFASTDGTNWGATGMGFGMKGLAYGNGSFVSVYNGGEVRSSLNGTNWQTRTSTTTFHLYDVAWGNGVFVAVGNQGTIIVSPDGTNWANRTLSGLANFPSVTFANGRFVAADLFYRFALSTDGTNWSLVEVPSSGHTSVSGGSGLVVASDQNRRLFVSGNLMDWSNTRPRTSFSFESLAFGNGTFVGVGFGPQIWQSDPILHLALDTNAPGNILIYGPPNRVCILERSEDLPATNWQSVGTLIFTNPLIRWKDPDGAPPRAFYRAVLQP